MKTAILKLRPNSQFHFGKVGLDKNMSLNDSSEYLHSDTLFSAMINIINSAVDDGDIIEDFIAEIKGNKIKFSSGFYMLSIFDKKTDKTNDIFFLPKPVNASVLEKENYKTIKKIKFVSKGILEAGTKPDEWGNEKTCLIIDKKFVCLKKELHEFEKYKHLKIYSVETEPKVRIRTNSKDGNLYNQSNLMIADNTFIDAEQNYKIDVNFYFLYDISQANELNQKLFDLFLDLLPETGIGGQRSTGCGFVKEVLTNAKFEYNIKNTKSFLCLSLFIPETENEFNQLEYYNFITRGGRNTGTDDLKQKRVRMITEGSISKSKLGGKVENITPDNSAPKYLRNGKGFFIEIN